MTTPLGRGRAWSLLLVAGLCLAGPGVAPARGQDTSTLVEVPLEGSVMVSLPGVTQVLVLEESISRAELVANGIRFHGLHRGDSVVFAWIGERRQTLLVRVVFVPAPVRTFLTPERVQQLGQGRLGTTAQVAIDPARRATYSYQHGFDWSQQVDQRRLSLRGQARHTTAPEVPLNVETLSVEYARPGATFTFLDFALSLNGGPRARVTSYSPIGAYMFRGADAVFTLGPSQIEVFAGTSIPSWYRSLQGTSQIAGVNFSRTLSPTVYLFNTTAVVNAPPRGAGPSEARELSVLHTSGLTYRFSERLAAQATGGARNRGWFGDAALAFTGDHLSAWASGTGTSADFPLTHLQVLSGGGTSARAGAAWKGSGRVGASMFYQQSATRAARSFASFAGTSHYISPSVSLMLSKSQSLSLNGVYSRTSGGLALGGQTISRSLDLGWTTQLGRFVNSAQVSGRSSEDARQGDRGFGLGFRNNLNVRVKGGFLGVGYQHSQEDPSLVTRLRQQIGLLSPSLQELFLVDPVAFVQSSSLPPDVRALLDSLQAANSQFSVSGQFQIGRRLNLSANYSLMKDAQTPDQRVRTNAISYAASFELTSTLQLRSSLSDTYLLDARQNDVVRTTTFQLGLNLAFLGGPAWLAPASRDYRIHGRVFIDRNVSGTSEGPESGLGGINVQLADGRQAVTDAEGQFQFAGLKVGSYRVSLPLDQFPDPVRATTMTSVAVELYDRPQATVDFGLVNFSRVLGTAFNDYALEGVRRADSPGLSKVAVIVTDSTGVERRIVTDGSGDYRIDDLAPGAYRLEVDPATIPPNFMRVADPVAFEVRPIKTLVVDVPIRALRSVAGHVYLSVPATSELQGDGQLVPAEGVTVTAGGRQSTTDATGRFMLRDLPAGDLTVTLKPQYPLPAGMSAPVGLIRLPKEPIAVEGATIVINNRSLVDYLVVRRGPGGLFEP